MSWIAAVHSNAAAVLDTIRARSRSGDVSNLWKALAHDPRGLAALYELHRTLRDDPSPLTAAQFELIAVVVSATNGCGYCVAHHGPALAEALADEALARAVARDYRDANLVARDRVLLDYAVALTCEPGERTRADVERVREYGFDDAAVVRATAVAAYYNHVNRLVSSLGVELESGEAAWEFGTQR